MYMQLNWLEKTGGLCIVAACYEISNLFCDFPSKSDYTMTGRNRHTKVQEGGGGLVSHS